MKHTLLTWMQQTLDVYFWSRLSWSKGVGVCHMHGKDISVIVAGADGSVESDEGGVGEGEFFKPILDGREIQLQEKTRILVKVCSDSRKKKQIYPSPPTGHNIVQFRLN